MVFSVFLWIKYSEGITKETDLFESLGGVIAQQLSRDDSYTVENISLLVMTHFEKVFLLSMYVSALNKPDLYHIVFLFMFVAYNMMPRFTKAITKIVLVYSFFFILVKYICTFLNITSNEDKKNMYNLVGITSDFDPCLENQPCMFEYPVKPQQWGILLLAYS